MTPGRAIASHKNRAKYSNSSNPSRLSSESTSPHLAALIATIMVTPNAPAEMRVNRPSRRKRPPTNSMPDVSGVKKCGKGIPQPMKFSVTCGRLLSLPQPLNMNTQPTVIRANSGASHARCLATRSSHPINQSITSCICYLPLWMRPGSRRKYNAGVDRSVPTADRVAGRLIERSRDQTALGDFDLVTPSVRHGEESRAPIQCVHPGNPRAIAVHQFPGIDAAGRVQIVNGAKLAALILDVCVAAADAFQSIGSVESDQIGECMPFENPRIDLPFISAKRKSGTFAVRIAQLRFERAVAMFGELQLAGGLFISQTLVAAQVCADQHRARSRQEEYERGAAVRYSAQHAPAAPATDRGNEEQHTKERADSD